MSQSNVETIISETRSSANAHLHSAQELSLLRHSLADELSYLSQELVSSMSKAESGPTLLEDIEALHRSLKELESVKGYVQVIEHALKLRYLPQNTIVRLILCLIKRSESAIQQIHASASSITEASVTEYQSLQDFVTTVTKSCSKVDDVAGKQTLQLVTFLDKIRDKTWTDMKGVLSA